MPRTVTVERTLYQYHELSDAAKERARDWWIEGMDNYWTEAIYEDADTIAGLMGIEIKHRDYKTVGGKTRTEPCIWWSGFWSQGDGACFEGRYRGVPSALVAVKTHVGEDEEIFRIAAELDRLQALCGGNLRATVTHNGNYYHSYSTDIEIEIAGDDDTEYDPDVFRDVEKDLCRALRDFMDWIYAQLEKGIRVPDQRRVHRRSDGG